MRAVTRSRRRQIPEKNDPRHVFLHAMIYDEFSDRTDLSRQRRLQLRRVREGLCVRCQRRAVTGLYCETHQRQINVQRRELWHKKHPESRRWKNAKSYQVGSQANSNATATDESSGRTDISRQRIAQLRKMRA